MSFRSQLVQWNKGEAYGAAKKFGQAIGVDANLVTQWASSKRSAPPRDSNLRKIAKGFGISLDEARGLFLSSLPVQQDRHLSEVLRDIEKKIDQNTKRIAMLEDEIASMKGRPFQRTGHKRPLGA